MDNDVEVIFEVVTEKLSNFMAIYSCFQCVICVFARHQGVCWHSGRYAVYVRMNARVVAGLQWRRAAMPTTELVFMYCRPALDRTPFCMTGLTVLSMSWRHCRG